MAGTPECASAGVVKGRCWKLVGWRAACSISAVEMGLLPRVPAPLDAPTACPSPSECFSAEPPSAGTACTPRLPCCLSGSFKGNCVFANRATNKHLNYCCSVFLHIKSHQKSNQLHPNGGSELWWFWCLQLSVRGQPSWEGSRVCDGSQ